MKDGIIAETGNSRYLRSIAGFMQAYPNYEAFAAALVAGTLPIDWNGKNPDGWAQAGTELNKANLLTDATAALMDLSDEATPNQMFAALANRINSTAENVDDLIRSGTTDLAAGTSALPTGTIYVKYE